ncbi:hypothetical protein AYX13_06226 [Cryptococcus neoformans]|nr:hypothetical protein AYX13_06226 [Cryptococcus neoformans var. grubii]
MTAMSKPPAINGLNGLALVLQYYLKLYRPHPPLGFPRAQASMGHRLVPLPLLDYLL